MSDIFDLLADDTRRELLTTLHATRVHGTPGGELSVSELVEKLGLSQPTVSKHLQKLREFGLVTVRTNGQHHFYRLEVAPLRELERWVADFLDDADEVQTAEQSDALAAFSAWSGADLGDTLGRRLAEGTHQARTAAADVQGRVAQRLPRIRTKKTPGRGVDGE
jgi:ArsR family transcriptional regulator, arsenate/arsenite/antimonite-responsive transcriptional repressor